MAPCRALTDEMGGGAKGRAFPNSLVSVAVLELGAAEVDSRRSSSLL